MAKTERSASASYKFTYPSVDDHGDTLTAIQGAFIQVKKPGTREYVDTAFVEFPKDEVTLEFTDDGAYGVRHVVVSSCTRSEPSEGVALQIDRRPPAKPSAGTVHIPCAETAGLPRS